MSARRALLKREFQSIVLEPSETVYVLQNMHRLRYIIANIQMIMEENEEKQQRIAFYDEYECILVTPAIWTGKTTQNHQYADHVG